MIDLTDVQTLHAEAGALIASLNGANLDESDALTGDTKGEERRRRAALSNDLNFLADRLTLAAALVRLEYWHARGRTDPLTIDPTRPVE